MKKAVYFFCDDPFDPVAGNVLKGMGAQAALTSRYAPAPAPRNA